MEFDKKVCLIAGCSQKKLLCPAPAIDLNQGQLFKAIKKLANNYKFDLKILSGKYGLIDANEIISPYDQKIRTKQDIYRIRRDAIPKLIAIWKEYDLIIIIMGKNYREVLDPLFDSKFIVVYDRRGIGGYLSLLSRYLKLTRNQFLQEIEQFRINEVQQNLLEKVKILEGST